MTAPVPPRLLEGVRSIDLTWMLVGSGDTRLLASRGAEGRRIEPADLRRVDLACYVLPYIQDISDPPADSSGMSGSLDKRFDRSGYYHNHNPGKRRCELPRAYNVLQSRQADVLRALQSSQARDGVHSGSGRFL